MAADRVGVRLQEGQSADVGGAARLTFILEG
jgi:hypothetical protein